MSNKYKKSIRSSQQLTTSYMADYYKLREERDMCIALLCTVYKERGVIVGYRDNTNEYGEVVNNTVFIDLPTGQISWDIMVKDLPNFLNIGYYKKESDGHSLEEKHKRIIRYIRSR